MNLNKKGHVMRQGTNMVSTVLFSLSYNFIHWRRKNMCLF